MNTRKQVLIMTGLIMVSLMILAVYAAWYPSRAIDAETEYEQQTAERGAILFARNCRLCHGDVGEGGALGGRLPAAPPLDTSVLQGFIESGAVLNSAITATDTTFRVSDPSKLKAGQTILINSERMDVSAVDGNTLTVVRGTGHTEVSDHSAAAKVLLLDAATLTDKQKLITNTITCGRVGTPMPAWAQTQGGPLSDEQIRQLMVLITTGRWDLVKEEVDAEDLIPARLTAEVSESTISLRVTDVSVFTAKDAIRIGDERLRVTAVPPKPDAKARDKSGILQVDRGIYGTAPLPHSVEELIYKFPETAEPAINQASCGQTARPAVAAREPRLLPDPFNGQTQDVVARGITFNVSQINAKTGGQIRVRFDNQDAATDHNIAFYKSSTDLTAVASGSVGPIFKGPNKDDLAFDVPAAGTYFFRCDVHPTLMFGNFVVTQ